MILKVAKGHALGNDFLIVIDLESRLEFNSDRARRLCDRHRGIGADGVIVVTRTPAGRLRMDLRNADGGEAEISGNGLRCVARHLVDTGVAPSTFDLDTAAGRRRITVEGSVVSSGMGVPAGGPMPTGPAAGGLDVVAVSLGNPHLVVFVDDPAAAPVAALGPALECDPAYPHRTNVAFVRAIDRATIAARIWERGVGETAASGTGGSASAVACRLTGRVDDRVAVQMPGGTLDIHWAGPATELTMAGPAVILFEVEVDIDALG